MVKDLYRPVEMSEITGVTTRTLRKYEKTWLPARKVPGSNRKYYSLKEFKEGLIRTEPGQNSKLQQEAEEILRKLKGGE